MAVPTSSDDPADKVESLAAGACAFHNKPGRMAELEHILRAVAANLGASPLTPPRTDSA
jgi:hypothetical protein